MRTGTNWTENADEIERLKEINAELLAALMVMADLYTRLISPTKPGGPNYASFTSQAAAATKRAREAITKARNHA